MSTKTPKSCNLVQWLIWCGHLAVKSRAHAAVLDGIPACKLFTAPELERFTSGRPCAMGCGVSPTFHSQMSIPARCKGCQNGSKSDPLQTSVSTSNINLQHIRSMLMVFWG